jgi:hypothetical protein
VPKEKSEDFYQRLVLEPSVTYSFLCSVQVATEVAAHYPGDVELAVKVSEAWTLLLKFNLLAIPVWELRAKDILPILSDA